MICNHETVSHIKGTPLVIQAKSGRHGSSTQKMRKAKQTLSIVAADKLQQESGSGAYPQECVNVELLQNVGNRANHPGVDAI